MHSESSPLFFVAPGSEAVGSPPAGVAANQSPARDDGSPLPQGFIPLELPVTEGALDLAESAQALAQSESALAQSQARVRELEEAWMRARADVENVRKRAAADMAQARKFALESFAVELLAVMDSLEAALQVKEATLESYRSGVELTGRQLSSLFEKFQIQEVNPVQEKFDPNRHQAIAALEDESVTPNTVLTVMQKGFTLHERVLRPALVTVAKARG